MGVRPLGNKSSWMQCLALRVEAHAGPIVLGTKSRVPKKKQLASGRMDLELIGFKSNTAVLFMIGHWSSHASPC